MEAITIGLNSVVPRKRSLGGNFRATAEIGLKSILEYFRVFLPVTLPVNVNLNQSPLCDSTDTSVVGSNVKPVSSKTSLITASYIIYQ